MRDVKSLQDAAQTIRDLDTRIKTLESKSLDLNGRRIMNISNALDPSDAVPLSQVLNFINRLESEIRSVRSEIDRIERKLADAGI